MTTAPTSAPQHRLDTLPKAPALLVRAAASALRRPKGVPELPRDGVIVRNVPADAERLANYREVCGLPQTDSLPLTWPHVFGGALHLWLMGRPGFPLPMVGLVHLANRFEQPRPIDCDRALDIAVRLDSSQRTDHGLEFNLVTTASAGHSQLWEGVSTYLYRMPSESPESSDKSEPEAPPRLDFQQALKVPADTGRRYAVVSGDYNPIHLAATTARLFGFPSAIAHGMWSAARCLAMLQAQYSISPKQMQLRFRKPLLLPARTELRSRASDKTVEFLLVGSEDRLHLDGTLR